MDLRKSPFIVVFHDILREIRKNTCGELDLGPRFGRVEVCNKTDA
jgi:hypothetical protein